MVRIAVFSSGYGSNFQALIDAVEKKKLPAEIALLVCDKPDAHSIVRAKKHNIPLVVLSPKYFPTREAYEKIIVSILKTEKVDLIILAGFMRILTPYLINAFKGKILNIHPSYLPAFKGAHAIRDAFEAKASFTGVSVHLVTPKVDDGPVLAQTKVKILKNDTLASLEKKIHKIEHKIYPETVRKFIKTHIDR